MSLPLVLITAKIPQAVVEQVKNQVELRYWTESPQMPRTTLLEWAKGVDGILCLIHDKINNELLDAAGPQLKVVSTLSVGFDHIDLQACKAHGVKAGNTPGVLTETTAETAITLLLVTARRISEAISAVKDGNWGPWQPEWMTGRDLGGSTVGIVGMGRIGATLGHLLSGFNCRLLYNDAVPIPSNADPIHAQYVSLDTLLAESDFVSLHTPLTPETTKMVNAEFLSKMKRTAILVNTSRGGVVDQEALYQALKNGVIAGAGLDVTVPEPLPTDHPLLSLPNCVILPHIGSATIATRLKMAQIAADNLLAGVRGQNLPNEVK